MSSRLREKVAQSNKDQTSITQNHASLFEVADDINHGEGILHSFDGSYMVSKQSQNPDKITNAAVVLKRHRASHRAAFLISTRSRDDNDALDKIKAEESDRQV